MTEGDFGATIKRSREQLGLSQARVGELVGRSPSTIRSWESGRSTPTDFTTITSLAAVLALDEFELSRAAGVEAPAPRSQLTLEQVLSEITPPSLDPTPEVVEATPPPSPAPAAEPEPQAEPERQAEPKPSLEEEPEPIPDPEPDPERHPAPFLTEPARAMPELDELPTRVHEPDSPNGRGRHVRLAETEVQTDPSPLSVLPAAPPGELSYLEDPSQKLLYRSRTVLTAAGVVAMFFLLLWSFQEATSAIDTFWELLTGNL